MIAEIECLGEALLPSLPLEKTSLEATGLDEEMVIDLALKTIFQRGPQTGCQLAEHLKLALVAIQGTLAEQRHLHILEVVGSEKGSFGEGAYIYQLTDKGGQRAQRALTKSGYVGPAPVPFEDYVDSVHGQSIAGIGVRESDLVEALNDLVLNPQLLDEVGPAVNSASSIFLYGAAGNGKTSLATRLVRLLGDPIFVPHAIQIEGSIMEFFDPVVHVPVPFTEPRRDRRWAKVHRPAVIVGGELTADGLDVHFNEHRKTYQPPFQMKANCGMFLIDDFGRQSVNPHQLLNRLIVPLEQKVDYMTLTTGTKLEVPFDEMVVFSTNLQPSELADEAFLRRIKYKIHLEDPTRDEFRQIFQASCLQFGIEFDEDGFDHLVATHYRDASRSFRAVHPRDLLDQMHALSRYKGTPALMTPSALDRAVRTYFAD